MNTTKKSRFRAAVFLLLSGMAIARGQASTRDLWLDYMDRVAGPVLSNLATGMLKQDMPVALSPNIDNPDNRKNVAFLEAFGRTLCGISPWLNGEGGSSGETAMRNRYREWALKSIANAVDPVSYTHLTLPTILRV